MKNLNKKVFLGDIVFSEKLINSKIDEYAEKINIEFKNKKLTIIIVLTGAVFFAMELIKRLNIESLEMDFIAVSSYKGIFQKKQMKFYKNTKIDLKDKNVLIIEDIIDSGETSKLILNFFKKKKLNYFKICSLIRIVDKTKEIDKSNWIYLLSLSSKKKWIVGFGLDYNEKYRNLKDIRYLNFKK